MPFLHSLKTFLRRNLLHDGFLTIHDTPLSRKVLDRYPYQVWVNAADCQGKDVRITAYSKGGHYLVDTLRTYLADYPGCCIQVYLLNEDFCDYAFEAGRIVNLRPPELPLIYIKGNLERRYGTRAAVVTVPLTLQGDELHEKVAAKTAALTEYVLEYCPTL